jgi:hypothetical protein
MTSPSRRGSAAVAAVLGIALAAGGCGAADDGGDGVRAAASPGTASAAPAATGGGPYPTPASPSPAAPVASRSPVQSRVAVPRPGDVDGTDADAVGRGALTVLWTYDTAVDGGPHDAELRAADAGWLTGAYAARLRARAPRSAPGAQWAQWARHRARTAVTLERAEDAARPADTGTVA